jgi:hypothetical protein
MAEAKTKRTRVRPAAFLSTVKDESTRRDCATLVRLMEKVTGEPAAMWGTSIVGFGTCHYVYASGTEGDCPLTGFSPRARKLTIYVMSGFDGHAALLKKLGKHETSKSCLYVKSLADVDLGALAKLLAASVASMRKAYPATATAAAGAAKKAATRKVAKPAKR